MPHSWPIPRRAKICCCCCVASPGAARGIPAPPAGFEQHDPIRAAGPRAGTAPRPVIPGGRTIGAARVRVGGEAPKHHARTRRPRHVRVGLPGLQGGHRRDHSHLPAPLLAPLLAAPAPLVVVRVRCFSGGAPRWQLSPGRMHQEENAGTGVWLNNRKRDTQRGYTRLAGVPPREGSTQQLQARVELLVYERLADGPCRRALTPPRRPRRSSASGCTRWWWWWRRA